MDDAAGVRDAGNAERAQPAAADGELLPRPAGRGRLASGARQRIERAVSGVSAFTREEAAANDRRLYTGAFKGPLLAMVAIAFAVAILVIGLTVYGSTTSAGASTRP